jgi:N-methylhydantoinase A
MTLRIGCDVGGTFTDFIFLDAASGFVSTGKVLTTPADPSEAMLAGIRDYYASDTKSDLGSAEQVIHGTTLAINALLERRGARTGLLVTRGFRDILDIRRCNRIDMYDLKGDFPPPLIARNMRREVDERIYSDGSVLAPLDENQARREIRALLREGVESIAVCTLHSYVNSAHEERLGELIAEEGQNVTVSISNQVAGEIKEFERLSTTAIDAYIKPKMQRYLTKLEQGLEAQGYRGRMYLMLSAGGVIAAETGKRLPARLVESGPIAGAIASKYFAEKLGSREVVSYDMGGTSAKACLIREGDIPITRDYEVDRAYRFRRGSGMPLSVPTVDLIEIGAGGGSIARIDELGLLRVGPGSAGAVPGPACYGIGGDKPTCTDADLILGYLDPEYFVGGKLRLDAAASEQALSKHIAEPLGIDVLKAAWGVHKVVNESMANALKTCVAERGGDIYRTTMVGFGGAGPVHAAQLARTLKIPKLLIPPFAGVVSALGFLLAPLAYDLVRTYKVPLDRLDIDKLHGLIAEMETEANRVVAEAGPHRPATTKR